MMTLRPWQDEVLAKACHWLLMEKKDRHFLINAAPGAGKTVAASVIANEMFRQDAIDRVVVIAPRREVVNQWAKEFKQVTGRFMSKVTGGDGDIAGLDVDLCATWAAIENMSDSMQEVCSQKRTLVICDEHHHAAVEAAWGSSANTAFSMAKYVLILTGTPIRSDGGESVWLAYDEQGAITHPEGGTYTLSYGEAVDLGYCRPITFHRHQGNFTVDLADGEKVFVSSAVDAVLSGKSKRIPSLQRALEFYQLAKTAQYENDGITPLIDSYQATMLEAGSQKLTQMRHRMPDAGGLVIAPSIELAEYMAELIEKIEGEKPIVVHSKMPNAEGKIEAFRNTDRRWLISVAMVSEGIDIKRLRVLVYLPSALTELAFRQSVGRVVRTRGYDDDTRAYVVMPSFATFEEYARRVENEMSPSKRKEPDAPKTKKCPVCDEECRLNAKACENCGHEFSDRPTRTKTCDSCGEENPITADICHSCGKQFKPLYGLTLDDALRTGAIVRGMDIDEDEVLIGEKISGSVRAKILKSGDEKLLQLVKTLPEESFGRLKNLLEQ
ncbi:DEAD/DEAH box helicase family protein [Gammaproteobacteria bacterium]|nr:DEAD/DEAH box helicase family protein [Gammaproteobacteria bacterium]